MASWKLNMTLRQFIIFAFLTLDIGLFVQPYPFDPAESAPLIQVSIFHRRQIVVANKQTDKGEEDGGEVMYVC